MSERRRLTLALALAVSACSALQPPVVETVSTQVLSARPVFVQPPARRDIAIEVATPRAWPGFDTTDIVYQRAPNELERYAVSRWIDTPSRMLAPLLVRALDDSGAFRAVVQPPLTAPADYRLDTEIVRLVQDFAVRPSNVRVAVRAQITDLRSRRVVSTRVFEDTEPAAADNAAAGTAAVDVALARILSQVVRFCIEASAVP